MENHYFIRAMKNLLSFESISEKRKKKSNRWDAIGNCQILPAVATNPEAVHECLMFRSTKFS